MNEACETLANTGLNQLLPFIAAFILIAVGLLFCVKRGYGVKILPLLIIASFSLAILSPAITFAQSSDDCQTQAPADDEEEPTVALSLTNDSGTMQLPDAGNPTVVYYVSLLMNDTAPSGDSFDPSTIDLDPDQDGQQTSIPITHPDDSDFTCGEIATVLFGVISVTLNYECYDLLANMITLDEDLVIPAFEYVVTTEGLVTASIPATVNVSAVGDPGYTITTQQDSLECESLQTVDILANDSTTIGSLDPDTIDLDPITPGIQQTFSYTQVIIDESATFTATVNIDGNIEVSSGFSNIGKDFFYTVQNTNGDTSLLTSIQGLACA